MALSFILAFHNVIRSAYHLSSLIRVATLLRLGGRSCGASPLDRRASLGFVSEILSLSRSVLLSFVASPSVSIALLSAFENEIRLALAAHDVLASVSAEAPAVLPLFSSSPAIPSTTACPRASDNSFDLILRTYSL